jgi:hypothetical protein
MHDHEVRWLFDQVKTNTKVIITNTSKSFESIALANGYPVTAKIKNITASIVFFCLQHFGYTNR